jgi:hypothetical protein
MINTLGPCGGGGCTIPGQAHRASIQPSNHRSLWLPLAAPLAAIFLTGISRRKLSRNVAVLMLCLSLIALGALVACGGGSSSGGGQQGPPAISVSVSAVPTSLYPNNTGHWPSQTAQFTATVHNSNNQGVTWSVTGGSANGTIDANGLYTAPQIVSGLPSSVTIVATAAADTTKSGSAKETLTPATVPGTYNVNVSATSGGSGPAPTTVQVTVQ